MLARLTSTRSAMVRFDAFLHRRGPAAGRGWVARVRCQLRGPCRQVRIQGQRLQDRLHLRLLAGPPQAERGRDAVLGGQHPQPDEVPLPASSRTRLASLAVASSTSLAGVPSGTARVKVTRYSIAGAPQRPGKRMICSAAVNATASSFMTISMVPSARAISCGVDIRSLPPPAAPGEHPGHPQGLWPGTVTGGRHRPRRPRPIQAQNAHLK